MAKKATGKKEDIKIIDKKIEGNKGSITYEVPVDFEMGMGSVVSRFAPDGSVRYSSYDTPMYDLERGVPTEFKDQVRLARGLYRTESITSTVIDVLVQFSCGEFENIHEDSKIKDFFDAIKETSNLSDIVKNIFIDYYIAGNAFPYRSEKGDIVKSRSGVDVPQYSWTVLNPEMTKVEGPLLFNQAIITLEPNDDLKEIFKSEDKYIKSLIRDFDKDLKKEIIEGKGMPLDPDRVYHIARNKQPYERYATPFIMRNVIPLMVKQKLLQMDLSTADGVINQLVTVTIGNDKFPAKQKHLDRVAELLRTPNKAYTLIWDHTLDVKFHKPEADLFDPEKYKQANEDILAGYGIVRQIISNENSSYAGQAVSIKSLIGWLESGRADVERWIEREYQKIAKENNLDSYPRVKFKKITISDEKSIQGTLFNLYDRSIISAESLLDNFGYSLDMEVDRLKEEQELQKEGLLIPKSPWQQSKDQQTPIGNSPYSGPGRPDGVEDEEQRERTHEPEPHGVNATLHTSLAYTQKEKANKELYTEEILSLWSRLKERILNGLSDIKDRDSYDDLIDGAIVAFISEMKKIGSVYITKTFTETYEDLSGVSAYSNPESLPMIVNVILWDYEYKDKLDSELREKLSDIASIVVDSDFSQLLISMEKIFESIDYRMPLFGAEAIKKSRFFSEATYIKTLGVESGVWQATFRNTCEECAIRHNQRYLLSELLENYPAHVNCECFIVWDY